MSGGPGPLDLDIRPEGTGCLMKVKVTPRGSVNAVLGVAEGALRLRLTAPPVEGAANAAARDFLAGLLALPRRSVELASGQANRAKVFRIEGLDASELRARLGKVLRPSDRR
jgi:uncharacterized protein (TIGR00251 family)